MKITITDAGTTANTVKCLVMMFRELYRVRPSMLTMSRESRNGLVESIRRDSSTSAIFQTNNDELFGLRFEICNALDDGTFVVWREQ